MTKIENLAKIGKKQGGFGIEVLISRNYPSRGFGTGLGGEGSASGRQATPYRKNQMLCEGLMRTARRIISRYTLHEHENSVSWILSDG